MPAAPAPATKRPPAADRVYIHVKQAVLDRRYEGGTLLTEGELAEAVGVSRTPVREALLKLEVEGLLKLYPKKGALVLAVSAQETADVVETRLLVEEFAVAGPCPRPSGCSPGSRNCWPSRRRTPPPGTWRPSPSPTAASTPRSCATPGNEILARLYDQMRDRQLRMGVAVMHAQPDRVAKNIAEHEEMLAAIRDGDGERAAHCVRQHLSWVKVLVRGDDR